jgi:hypothetical protein
MTKEIIGFLVALSIITIIPIVNAQISLGEKAEQKSVEVVINAVGDVHVKHTVRSSNVPKQIDLIYGTVSNLSVTNKQGDEKQFSVIGDNNGVLILPSNDDSIVEYDLEHVLTQVDGVWTWSFMYLETTSFILPEEVDLIFANEKPVYLNDKKGIACHGCQMLLEYSINEPKIIENVKWENREFAVEIRSHSNIDKFTFDQLSKSITFDVAKKDKFVTTIIPLELLWGPYAVFLDDEKIYFHEYINNGTHVWLNMRPENSGEVSIVGTTVVPEFPVVAPLAIGFLMILILPIIRRVNLH